MRKHTAGGGADLSDGFSRFVALVFYVSFFLFIASLLPGGRPEPLLFFFNLAPKETPLRKAAELPALKRWVIVDAELDLPLFYMTEEFDAGPGKKGCRTFLVGSFKPSEGARLPFKTVVEENPDRFCESLGVKDVSHFSELPPAHLAKLAPGDFSLAGLLELKTPEDIEEYMAKIAPGKFQGFLRVKNADVFPVEITRGETPSAWLDIGAGPSFFSSITFLLFAVSAAAAAMIMIRRRARLNPEPPVEFENDCS